MCDYCGQHCVEDEPFRGDRNVPENICPDKVERVTRGEHDINDIILQGWNIDSLIEELAIIEVDNHK